MTTVSTVGQTSGNQFADEEIESSYGYFSCYYTPNRDQPIDAIIADFERRMSTLNRHFNIGTRFDKDWIVRTHGVCPDWVEKFFPNFAWQMIAPSYGEAVEEVVAKLIGTGEDKTKNWRRDELSLRQLTKTAGALDMLSQSQKDHNIRVVPAQFGIRHHGRSARRAREVMGAQEFGLGAFAVGIMLLTYPERLMRYDDLFIYCAGDEYALKADGNLSYTPIFYFDNAQVIFGAHYFDRALSHYGSASGFLPQS